MCRTWCAVKDTAVTVLTMSLLRRSLSSGPRVAFYSPALSATRRCSQNEASLVHRRLIEPSYRLLHQTSSSFLQQKTTAPPSTSIGPLPGNSFKLQQGKELDKELLRTLCEPRPSNPLLVALMRSLVKLGYLPSVKAARAVAAYFVGTRDVQNSTVRNSLDTFHSQCLSNPSKSTVALTYSYSSSNRLDVHLGGQQSLNGNIVLPIACSSRCNAREWWYIGRSRFPCPIE